MNSSSFDYADRMMYRPAERRFSTALSLAGGLLLSIVLMPTQEATAFDAESGKRLATQWCSKCHLVGPDGVATDAAPAFEDIANDPARTNDRLRTWLADPHPPMPDLSLSRDEIEAILAYLDTLRAE